MVALYDQLGPASRKLREAGERTYRVPTPELPIYEAAEVAGWSQPQISAAIAEEKAAKESVPAVKLSRIRIQLSRPLTWAEKEHLETNWDDPDLRRVNDSGLSSFSLRVADNREHVWVEAAFGSRISYELIAAALEQHFVNVFPKAVRTFREYNGE